MLRLALPVACLALALPLAAHAGPMPTLPELPPLPTNYDSQGPEGFYAGILAGYVGNGDEGLGAAVVVGNTFMAADILLGAESIVLATTSGDVALEGSLRGGFALTDTLNVFAVAGLGYSRDTDLYLSAGASAEFDVGGDWLVRSDYRYNHDLSDDVSSQRIMTGLVHRF